MKPTHQQILDSDWPYDFVTGVNGEEFDGCCPCGEIDGRIFMSESIAGELVVKNVNIVEFM